MAQAGSTTTAVALVAASFLFGIYIYAGCPEQDLQLRQPAWRRRELLDARPPSSGHWLLERTQDGILMLLVVWVLAPVLALVFEVGGALLHYVRVLWSPPSLLPRWMERAAEDELLTLPLRATTPGAAIEVSQTYGACVGQAFMHLAGDAASNRPPVQPVALASAMASQEPFLMWQMGHPDGTAANLGWCVWLESQDGRPVCLQALRRSFRTMLDENEGLRCRFKLGEDGNWLQEVLPTDGVFSEVYREHFVRDQEQALQVADEAMHTPLRIFEGVCLRAGAVRVSCDQVLLYVVQHHAVTDGKSSLLTYKQLSAFFKAETSGLQLVRPAPPNFRHIVALRHIRRSCNLEHLNWWRKHLGGGEALMLDLPGDRPEPVTPSFEVVLSRFEISPELSAAIQGLAVQEMATTFEVLLALHSAWLSLLSNAEELLVWTNAEGRGPEREQGADAALGCFISQLPLRLAARAGGSFRELLHHVSQTKREAMLHADAPPAEMYKLAQVSGDSFERGHTVMTYHSNRFSQAGIAANAAKDEFGFGVAARVGRLHKRTGCGLLQVFFSKDTAGHLVGHGRFAADRFSQAAADRLTHYFVLLASRVLLEPEVPLATLPLCDAAAEAQLDTFHGQPLPRPAATAVELLRRCAAVAPSHVALEHEESGQRVTYGELLAQSRALAARLRALGLCADALVPLLLERSLDMMLAIHGVWAAGCGYVPVDTDAPSELLGAVAADVAAHNRVLGAERVLLTQSTVWQLRAGQMAPSKDLVTHILCLDSLELPPADPSDLEPLPEGKHIAYCLYTSGSTGRPKGVMVPHQGLANYIQACEHKLEPLEQTDVILQKTPYIFDVSLYEFVSPLVAASKLVILKHGMHKDARYLFEAMSRCGITRTRFVPSHFELFLEVARSCGGGGALGEPLLPELKVIGCSGEVLSTELARRSFQLLPNMSLYDLYGPTEASVDVTCLQCTGAALRHGRKTIGHALRGVQLFVAAAQPRGEEAESAFRLQRLPVGLRGELVIGGVQVARGYLNLPDRTRDAFVPVTYKDQEAAVVYRTGDLVKWDADGQLVFLGRLDRQVKLHGLRVELGAVEAAAARAPGVGEAVAKLHCDDAGPRLVLFVTPSHADVDVVMCSCRQALPAYMLPSEVLAVDDWPRTASGKIDIKRLRPPSRAEGAQPEASSKLDAAVLAEKIKVLGVVNALADEEVGRQGWNSFEVMRMHVQLMNSSDPAGGDCALPKADIGVIAVVGHIWALLMPLVVLEWLVAYWEWYMCIPAVAGRWHLDSYWPLGPMNALGRLLGDPIFVMLFAIQDMKDVRGGRTAQLCRRAALFALLSLLGTVVNKLLLQGTFVRRGWLDASWALDDSRVGGTMNCGIFMAGRTFFLLIAILMSMGQCSWMRVSSAAEWPWACLGFALLVPAVLEGVTPATGFGDGSFASYARGCKGFIVELSPYYFLFPLFVGGAQFPRNIVSQRARLSGLAAVAAQLAGLALFAATARWLSITNFRQVDELTSEHTVWISFLDRRFPNKDSWYFLNAVKQHFDIYGACVIGVIAISLALAMPMTPTEFSLLGTRVMGTYLTMPLTLIASGHFVGPVLLSIPPEHQALLMPCGIVALIMLCTILTAQQILPESLLHWVEHGCGEAPLLEGLPWLGGGAGRDKDFRGSLKGKRRLV